MIKYLRILLLLIIVPAAVRAQQGVVVSGRLFTADRQPAIGVTVTIVETGANTLTNAEGKYLLKLNPGNYTLQFSSMTVELKIQSITVQAGETLQVEDVTLNASNLQLKDVVVTGQYAPQSLKNSVYNIRTITAEQIKMRNPTKVQDVLSDQLGFRFSNDLTLGTSDVVMMGISGQRVKILLDGIPLLDRGDTRESLNQIDINQIDHIEIVEGPMSVSYGTDALAGVINLITKQPAGNNLQVSGRIQEESAGHKYKGFDGSGNHLENLGLNWGRGKWQLGGNFTRNFFDAAQLGWMPKDQYLGSATAGYRTNDLHVWYRLDAENETLRSDGAPNPNTHIETDAHYITYRWMHQVQADWKLSDRLSFNGAASYTDYSRRTQTTTLNTLTGDRRLTLGAGEQDKSVFDTKFFKGTAQYRISDQLSLQPGFEINLTGSSGARILGTPNINDYAFFISGEYKPTDFISLRPGARFIKNSVYDAPPVIPALNTKIALAKAFDLRLAYARGFRSPALRELYFNFFDASHSIRGNQNLKAEFSNSFNGSLSWQPEVQGMVKWKSALGGFYNDFNNLITTGYSSADASIMTYINVDKAKTAGGSFDNTIYYQNLTARIGFGYTGVYSQLDGVAAGDVHYVWYPEVSSTLMYNLKKLKGNISLFYKYNGPLPSYEINAATNTVHLAKRSAYSLADLTLNKQIRNRVTLSGGIKNLFNVTSVLNTSVNVGGAHSNGGPVPLGYGRSYFLGLNFQLSKN